MRGARACSSRDALIWPDKYKHVTSNKRYQRVVVTRQWLVHPASRRLVPIHLLQLFLYHPQRSKYLTFFHDELFGRRGLQYGCVCLRVWHLRTSEEEGYSQLYFSMSFPYHLFLRRHRKPRPRRRLLPNRKPRFLNPNPKLHRRRKFLWITMIMQKMSWTWMGIPTKAHRTTRERVPHPIPHSLRRERRRPPQRHTPRYFAGSCEFDQD